MTPADRIRRVFDECPQCHLSWSLHPKNKDGEFECHLFEIDGPVKVTR